ncbi:HTH domain-containing protein [Paraflavitalea sp. CAU 1676]|uniref:HTH domain-containing protein n=1 Tax=Paraflavitalea sp. CAU 1676 TaxID=3032598 RepID=UPI0023DAD641|nr:HTH domain-containing protein [Paraflavitalea sp. CAU 1676]MDF2191992.1 HTH domain-containing protein [Paraflavitalea sp. CAU 1676]
MPKQYLDRLQTLDRLIRIKGTGTPKQLADRLDISERTLYRLIDTMRSLGAPIAYSESRQSYYYIEEGTFTFNFQRYTTA